MSRYDTDYSKMGFSTRAIKIGEGVDPVTKALNTPIYETSTYGYETAEQYDEMLARGAQWEPDIYIYSRTTNPTTNALEEGYVSGRCRRCTHLFVRYGSDFQCLAVQSRRRGSCHLL